MSKRFPVPDFDRVLFKNLPWTEPSPLPSEQLSKLAASAKYGAGHAVAVGPRLADRLGFKMEGKAAVICLLPDKEVRMTGRSWAWPIQRAVVVDSLDPDKANVVADWHTPRPMNTRLGPDGGVIVTQKVLYVLCGHQYGDHWIANRTLIGKEGFGDGGGFSVLSATDDSINDFHACNVMFSWK